MFLGHFAVALAAKRVEPRVSLGTLFFAATFLDLIWPVLLLTGLERVVIAPGITAFTPLDFVHYPISHSLLAVLGWSVLVGGAYFVFSRVARAALLVGTLVASHWFLDVVVHRPDLPLAPGSDAVLGVGLWNSVAATLALELALFGTGAWLYLRGTEPADDRGRLATSGLLASLLVIFLMNAFGSPPPSWEAVAVVTLGLWLFVPWAAWADRHRRPRPRAAAVPPAAAPAAAAP